jgi:hypothetical protein
MLNRRDVNIIKFVYGQIISINMDVTNSMALSPS